MKNEPVAWITENGRIFDELPLISDELMPLYANPVKELTDDEITDLFRASSDHIEFARAVLKKAKE